MQTKNIAQKCLLLWVEQIVINLVLSTIVLALENIRRY